MENFFDIPREFFSKNSDFYFNILVISIAVRPELMREYLGVDGIDSIWFLTHLTDSRPKFIYCYAEEKVESDLEFEVYCESH